MPCTTKVPVTPAPERDVKVPPGVACRRKTGSGPNTAGSEGNANAAAHNVKEQNVRGFGGSPQQWPEGLVLDPSKISRRDIKAVVRDWCTHEHPKVKALVTKLLDRKEWDQKAYDAIKKEGRALIDMDTWLESTVTEKVKLLESARAKGEKIHLGDLLTLCSIKYYEMHPNWWKHKGRICYRGDNAKDQEGAAAVYQELSANPTSIQSANCNMAYGCFPGNKTTTADAVRAYVQAKLRSKSKTWVRIPKELWRPEWHGKFTQPMCLLEKALYGHPESGAHWEEHLTKAIKALGGEPVEGHPSSFFVKKTKLLLTVYVDDLLLSGPASEHAGFWKSLSAEILVEDPEPLSRFLGRTHEKLCKPKDDLPKDQKKKVALAGG